MSIEKMANIDPRTASLWHHHLKFPLNSALQSLKVFSQWLRSRVHDNHHEWEMTGPGPCMLSLQYSRSIEPMDVEDVDQIMPGLTTVVRLDFLYPGVSDDPMPL